MDKERINEICEFIIKGALYSRFELTRNEQAEIINYASKFSGLDFYCPDCQSYKTFIYDGDDSNNGMGRFKRNVTSTFYFSNIKSIVYKCPSCNKRIYVEFLFFDNYMIKLAQYPALSEVGRDELKQFQNNMVIDKEYFQEIQKAEVCAGDGYYIAAFTYMRRVFENLIKNIFNYNRQNIGINYEEYIQKKADEKIAIIKNYLPVDDDVYAPIFSLLSENIHLLTEEECAGNYKLLKLVLLELLATFKAKEEQEETRKQVKDLLEERKSKLNEDA